MRYSIWVIPPEPIFSQLSKVIYKLSQEYNGPIFEPHMTILGSIDRSLSEIEQKVKELASHIDKLELGLGSVSFSTTYFQSVLIRVNSTAQLMKVNIDAKKLFNMENNVFMPHISLLYGDHSMVVREKIASELQISSSSFTVNEFIITPAVSDLKQWDHSLTIPFGNFYK